MVWRNLIRKSTDTSGDREEEHARKASPAQIRRDPVAAHLTGERPRSSDDPDERRRAGLRRQRIAILYDIEQGELAASPENPWTSRIGLLGDALETVNADLRRATKVEPGLWHPMPDTPIRITRVDIDDGAGIEFSVGDERFSFVEVQDWAERGHQIAQPELVHHAGDAERIVPGGIPAHVRDEAREHLASSLFVFAASLRDGALDGEPLPDSPTLADLARPCPVCGGWTDWRGTCQACARRNAEIAALRREEARLLDERNREAQERHRLMEGLPVARRRLRDVEAELARLGETFDPGAVS